MLDELRAFHFCQHELAHGEFPDLAILKGAVEIFRAAFDPAFGDLNLRIEILIRSEVDLEMIFANVVADFPALLFRGAKQDID